MALTFIYYAHTFNIIYLPRFVQLSFITDNTIYRLVSFGVKY